MKLFNIALCALLLFAFGCDKAVPIKATRTDNVVSIQPTTYGYLVLVEHPENKELSRFFLVNSANSSVKLFKDCPKDKPMWFNVDPDPADATKKLFTIHVHDEKDIQGGVIGK